MDLDKTYLDYLVIISKVLKDKCWHSLWNMDLFERVERVYPGEDYRWLDLLDEPSYVIDCLYLGSAFNAADYKWLKANQVDLIVNVTGGISNFYPEDFEYQNYHVEDLNGHSLKQFYQNFYQLMLDNQDKTVLVHCYAGRSRSASLVLYYLAKRYEMTVDQALGFLKSQRPIININQDFINEIKQLLDHSI